MKPDLFQAPDYYNLDDLLTDEHKLVRESARAWVKREVSPIIEEFAQKAEFPKQITWLLFFEILAFFIQLYNSVQITLFSIFFVYPNYNTNVFFLSNKFL